MTDTLPYATATPDGERMLRQFSRTRDPELRRRIVERYLPLARYAASRYAKGQEPFDDLLQVASIGLLKAIDRFDPHNGAAFSSYALPTMQGELRRHFRDRSWSVRPPRDLQEQALLVERVTTQLQTRQRGWVTVQDVARESGLSEETVLEAREALNARHAGSLSADADDEDQGGTLARRHGELDAGFELAESRATVDALAAGVLTHREREILRLRFDADLTQSEIGEQVGLSQMHVSRVLRASMDRLRAAATATQ